MIFCYKAYTLCCARHRKADIFIQWLFFSGVEEVMTLNMCLIYAQSLPLPPTRSYFFDITFIMYVLSDYNCTWFSHMWVVSQENYKRKKEPLNCHLFLCNLWSHFWWLKWEASITRSCIYHVRVETVSEMPVRHIFHLIYQR